MNKIPTLAAAVLLTLCMLSSCSMCERKKEAAIDVNAFPVWSPDSIKMVHLEDSCQYISDPDNFVLPETKDKANRLLRRLETSVGVQASVVVAGRIKGGNAQNFAIDLADKYGAGDTKNNRNIVLVIAVEDRNWFMTRGAGLQKELPDTLCLQYGEKHIVPNINKNNPDRAVYETVKAIFNKLKKADDETTIY